MTGPSTLAGRRTFGETAGMESAQRRILDARAGIVVGIDQFEESLAAAHWGIEEANLRDLDLVLAHGYGLPTWATLPAPGTTGEPRGVAEDLVESVLSRLRVPPTLQIRVVLEPLSPVVLLDRLSATATSLVVGHNQVAWSRQLLIGSVASAVAATALCPVVTVPRPWPRPEGSPGGVVAALDGETRADDVLRYAYEEAGARQAAITVLTVVRPRASSGDVEEQTRDVAEILAGWQADFPEQRVQVHTIRGVPQDVLTEVSRSADLLVVGKPTGGLPLATWTRSVAREVLKRARCPLAIVPLRRPGPARRRRVTPSGHSLVPTY